MPNVALKKRLRKLKQKKFRWQWQQFVAEGPKVVQDLLQAGLKADVILATQPTQYPQAQAVSEAELQALTQLSTSNEVLAIFNFPKMTFQPELPFLVLDGINDPGNLGTLIRTADWFGLKQVVALPGTADVFNAKTVQSTMGSLGRVAVLYQEPQELFEKWKASHLWLKADMAGTPLTEFRPPQQPWALVLGSESHGPSSFWDEKTQALTLPKKGQSAIDSLNVGVAGSIFMHHLVS